MFLELPSEYNESPLYIISPNSQMKSTFIKNIYDKVKMDPLGTRILLKHVPLFPGFLAIFFVILPSCVQKSVEKNYSILTITSCVYFEE